MDEEERKEEKENTSEKSNGSIYIVFALILLIAVGGSYYFGRKSGEAKEIAIYSAMKPTGSNTNKPSGSPSMKGQKFTELPFANNAYQIFPGTVSKEATAAMSGWTLKTKTLADGSTQAVLIPVGSEATEGDTMHTFIVKTGYKLYFVDINPNDDQPGGDQRTADDLGILVDADGIVQ